jgi:hypothetical protein
VQPGQQPGIVEAGQPIQPVPVAAVDLDGPVLGAVEPGLDRCFRKVGVGGPDDAFTGATAPYSQTSNITDTLGVPGDFSSATETVTGQGNITLPGRGAVLLNAGRTVWAPDGSLDFRAGPQDFLDFFLGNTDKINELCAALGAN